MSKRVPRALKWLHVAALVGFGIGMAAAIVISLALQRRAGLPVGAPWANASAYALAMRISGVALLALVASGMLLLARRPGFLEQRWLLAKLLLTMVIAPAVWMGTTPLTLALAAGSTLLATLLAVWRPRLGAPPST